MCFLKYLTVTFSFDLAEKIILFLLAKYDFHISLSLKPFASKAETSAVSWGTLVMI